MVNKLQTNPGSLVHVTIPGLGWKTDGASATRWQILSSKSRAGRLWCSGQRLGKCVVSNPNWHQLKNLLAHPDINLVYSSWGMPAVGAAKAIHEAGLQDKVFVVNTDADRIVLAEMAAADSPIAAVIGQKPTLEGEMAIDYLERAFNDKTDIPKIAFTRPTL